MISGQRTRHPCCSVPSHGHRPYNSRRPNRRTNSPIESQAARTRILCGRTDLGSRVQRVRGRTDLCSRVQRVRRCTIEHWTIAPVLAGGLVFMGEVAKLVPVARGRVRSVSSMATAGGSAELRVTVVGVAGEAVTLGYMNTSDPDSGAKYVTCAIPELGVLDVDLVGEHC